MYYVSNRLHQFVMIHIQSINIIDAQKAPSDRPALVYCLTL
jgi:hypothetical protein